jgi:cell division protein FtsI/penicillin-binding protein 2
LSTNIEGGFDVVLTIEPRVQATLEEALREALEKWGADSAGGLVLDPQTGAVIAMASLPSFDPNKYAEVENISYFRNPLISDIFELGSVVKPLTLAAAMDAGKINPTTTYFDKGYEILNGQRIENYDGKGRGWVDMQAVLNKSLNTGAIFAMQQLGKEQFRHYLQKYGLGQKTGIDLPQEVAGQLSNLSSSRDIEYATASFGHGIAISPLEFATAASSIANGGLIMRPYVVAKLAIDGGKDKITEALVERRALKQETSEEITRMLVEVVDDALLGGTVKMQHYSIAAKTGTAQLPKEGQLGYYEDKYLHSFFGYAPAFDPQFLIFLYLKNPHGMRYASRTLTDPFMDLTKFLINYYEIPPDR